MNKATTFMNAGWVGLACLAVWAFSGAFEVPKAVGMTAAILTVLACWAMLFTRNADEYTRGLWTSAASFAFAALLLLFLGMPFVEGFYDGVRSGIDIENRDTYSQDLTPEVSIVTAIAAFYIGLFWKRVRG